MKIAVIGGGPGGYVAAIKAAMLGGDVTVIENSSSGCYYVLYFINKSYDGSSDETIASNVLNNKYSEYISNITDSMQVDIYNRF